MEETDFLSENRMKVRDRTSIRSPMFKAVPATEEIAPKSSLLRSPSTSLSERLSPEGEVSLSSSTFVDIEDSEEYDTDLDDAENVLKEDEDDHESRIGKDVYLKACKKLRVMSPQSHILQSLPEKSLSLKYRSLGSAAIRPLCAAMKDNLRVERLNLDGTDLGDEGAIRVAQMLLDNITLYHVTLSNNNIGLKGSQVIGHVMSITHSITYLNLSGNKLDDQAAWYICLGLAENTSLDHLDLSYNNFGEKSGKIIGGAIAENVKLKHLNLNWNHICGKGAVAIFQALKENSTLKILDIAWNGLGYEGSLAVMKALKSNTGLEELDISNNRITWKGALLISKGLKLNENLNILKISNNPLTTTGCMDILEAVSVDSSSVRVLDMSDISVLAETDLLAATICRKRKFRFIHGGIVGSPDKLGERLERDITPMERILDYLKRLGLRPLELLRAFDKSVTYETSRQEFITRLKKTGIKLHQFEMEALASSLATRGGDGSAINYRKLIDAIREHIKRERDRKNAEKRYRKKVRDYHTLILERGNPEAPRVNDQCTETVSLLSITELKPVPMPAVFNDSITLPRVKAKAKGTLSMSAPLGKTKVKTKSRRKGAKRKGIKSKK